MFFSPKPFAFLIGIPRILEQGQGDFMTGIKMSLPPKFLTLQGGDTDKSAPGERAASLGALGDGRQ